MQDGITAHEYDVIVVGAGSTGSVLAARLSERMDLSVLLLEGGPVPDRLADFPPEVLDPSLVVASMPGHPNNWSFQAEVGDGVRLPIARGKIAGGCSSLNGASWIRATPENFAHWERLGNTEWSFERALPYYRRSETDLDFGGELHGDGGPITVQRQAGDRDGGFTDAFVAACLDHGFGSDPDKNGPGGDGVGAVPMNIGDGVRMSTGVAYLLPARDRPNLHVLGDAFVRKVVIERGRATGVEAEIDGARRTFHGDQIVLSAGAIQSPHLLMLSGVGPADMLRAQEIPVVHDAPGVGAVLNHTELLCSYRADVSVPVLRNAGVLTSVLHWTSADAAFPGDLEILPFASSLNDLMGGTAAAVKRSLSALGSLRGASIRRLLHQVRQRNELMMALTLVQPLSSGTISLESPDPHVQPAVDYGFFEEGQDRRAMRECVRVARELFGSRPLRALDASITGLGGTVASSDAELDEWIDAHLFPSGHPSSSCRMGPRSDPAAVVDQDGSVYGVERLRVADTSIFPYITSRGPNPTAVMVGERLADVIGGTAPAAPPVSD